MDGVLLVAATERELCGHPGLVCGIGPVEAAAATARALAGAALPSAVLHVGLAGGRGLAPGSIVIGTEAVYCDLCAGIELEERVPAPDGLVQAARRAAPFAALLPIATSAAVGAAPSALRVEAMEGFGVLRAAALAGVPAVEVRAISNEIGEADRSLWRLDLALDALALVLPSLLREARAT